MVICSLDAFRSLGRRKKWEWKTKSSRCYNNLVTVRSSRPELFCEKGVLKSFTKFTGKHLCQSVFFFIKVEGLRLANLLKKTLAQLFSCEFCEIFKNTFFHRILSGGCFSTVKTGQQTKRSEWSNYWLWPYICWLE